MKTTTENMFSNSTEHAQWVSRNCDRCIKQSRYNEKTDECGQFRCSIDRDISAQAAGLSEVSIRSYQAVRYPDCPYIQTTRKTSHRKRPVKGQMELPIE